MGETPANPGNKRALTTVLFLRSQWEAGPGPGTPLADRRKQTRMITRGKRLHQPNPSPPKKRSRISPSLRLTNTPLFRGESSKPTGETEPPLD
jgi:hypothetical protein